ncbi:MAG: 4-hydroxyphenylacetate 3-hydroxylase N-terminal domain-containing protein [Pseudomonadota bacterium]
MGIRTVDEYKASLRDGRRVYIRGEKVEDVTQHRVLGVSVDTVAQGFALTASADPEIKNLFIAPHPKTGEPINRYFITPRNAEDLMQRTKMIQRSIELTGGLPFGKDIGTDCLNAAFVVAGQMGKKQYQENALNFLEYVRQNDLAMCGAVTCVKGDRSQEPSQQKHPNYYLRVVDKNKDGIVVKGAKIHITSAPVANEIIVVPTRQMRENEGDYAVSFAIPANAQGITFICRGGRGPWTEHEFHPDHPVRELTEAMIVFDNVFVPWERVFMCGEWQSSMLLAYTFATFHRFTAISYKVPAVEVMAGCAVALAELNGLEKVAHIRDKLADIAAYVETLRALTNAAAKDPVMYGDIAVPNPLIANMAKLHFASKYHEFVKLIQDIAGGLVATAPDRKDWENPDIHDYLEHYLGGSARFSTEDRLKMIAAAQRMVCSHESAFHEVTTVHAEGSMAAQKMMILFESPLKKYKAMAKRAAGIKT